MLKCDCCSVNWAKWVVKKAKRDEDRGDVDTYPERVSNGNRNGSDWVRSGNR